MVEDESESVSIGLLFCVLSCRNSCPSSSGHDTLGGGVAADA